MNIFERVKSAVTVQQAAQFYGIKKGRSDMVSCLFHQDKHPSMKLNRDYFYCFSCGAHGDVIDLTAGFFEIRKIDAARRLASDFGISEENGRGRPDASHEKSQGIDHRITERKQRDLEHETAKRLCEFRFLLMRFKQDYVPAVPESDVDERFTFAVHHLDFVEELLDRLLMGSPEERKETVSFLMKDDWLNKKIRYAKNMDEKGGNNGKKDRVAG